MLTFKDAIAAQRAHHAKVDTNDSHNFLEYLLEHDEETYEYLLEALGEEDDVIYHDPSDAHWSISAIAEDILRAASVHPDQKQVQS